MKIMVEIYTDKISGIAKKEGPIEEGQLEKPSSCNAAEERAPQKAPFCEDVLLCEEPVPEEREDPIPKQCEDPVPEPVVEKHIHTHAKKKGKAAAKKSSAKQMG